MPDSHGGKVATDLSAFWKNPVTKPISRHAISGVLCSHSVCHTWPKLTLACRGPSSKRSLRHHVDDLNRFKLRCRHACHMADRLLAAETKTTAWNACTYWNAFSEVKHRPCTRAYARRAPTGTPSITYMYFLMDRQEPTGIGLRRTTMLQGFWHSDQWQTTRSKPLLACTHQGGLLRPHKYCLRPQAWCFRRLESLREPQHV